MDSPEFNEIMASLQGIARRAYSLGRSEALKRVIETMEKDESTWKPLAISGPAESAAPAHGAVQQQPHQGELPPQPVHAETGSPTVANPTSGESSAPWYLRTRTPPVRRNGAR